LVASNPGAQVVLIGDSAADLGIPTQSRLERPEPWERISRSEWVAKIREMLPGGRKE
jgi:hypothetical protein